jgi:hypothetical protein
VRKTERVRDDGSATQLQDDLQSQKLVEDQAPLGWRGVGHRGRQVNRTQGARSIDQVQLLTELLAERINELPERSSASSMNPPSSHDVSPALPEAG